MAPLLSANPRYALTMLDQNTLQQLRQLVAKLHLLRLDHTEYALLKALVLFKPGLNDFTWKNSLTESIFSF